MKGKQTEQQVTDSCSLTLKPGKPLSFSSSSHDTSVTIRDILLRATLLNHHLMFSVITSCLSIYLTSSTIAVYFPCWFTLIQLSSARFVSIKAENSFLKLSFGNRKDICIKLVRFLLPIVEFAVRFCKKTLLHWKRCSECLEKEACFHLALWSIILQSLFSLTSTCSASLVFR